MYFTVIIVCLITAAMIKKKITLMSLLSKIQFTGQFNCARQSVVNFVNKVQSIMSLICIEKSCVT